MKAGQYRVRRGFRNTSVLQKCFDGPSFLGGQVDAGIRVLYWADVPYDQAPTELHIGEKK